MNAIIYTRVSTEEQAKTGFSLARQESECVDYAKRNNFEILKTFKEEGASAKSTNRPQLQKLIKYCIENRKNLDYIIVWKLDRFARNLNDQIELSKQLGNYGIRILSVTENNEDNATGNLMRNIIGSFAQYENDVKSERVIAGMKQAFLEGKWQWRAPVGYRTILNNIEPDPKNAPLIRKAFNLFATGLYTQVQIIAILEKEGLSINPTCMSKMLKNKVYCGFIEKKEWAEEPIKGKFEPIISEETFYKVQNILNGGKPLITPHNRNNPLFPLRQFITCPYCNQPLTASNSRGRHGKKYAYYHCYNQNCTVNFRISKDRLEESFAKYLKRIKPNKDTINLFKAIMEDVYIAETKEQANAVKKLQAKLEETNANRSKLLDLYIEGKVKESDYKLKSQEYSIKEQALKAEIITNELPNNDFKDCLEYACNSINDIENLWKNSELDIKQRLQKLIFPKGITYDLEKFRTPEKSCLFTIIGALSAPNYKMVPPGEFESPSTP